MTAWGTFLNVLEGSPTPGAPASRMQPADFVPKPLVPGHWYSILVRATSPGASTGPLKIALLAQGFTVTTAKKYDDGGGLVLGRFDGKAAVSTLAFPADWVPLYQSELSTPEASVISPTLDANLDVPTAQAVKVALARESDPAAMLRFSNLLLPASPAAAALLKTHATMTLALQGKESLTAPTTSGFGIHIDLSHFAKDIGQAASHLAADAGKAVTGAAAKVVASVAETVTFSKPLAALVSGIAKGQPIGEILKGVVAAGVKNMKDIGPYAESIVAAVPGIGPEVSSSLALGVALAEGKPMSQAALDAAAAAIPGGPIVQSIFKTAVSTAQGVLQHKPFSAIVIQDIRMNIPKGPLKDAASAAFDAGMALAHGKTLQDAGFLAAKDFLPGDAAKQSLGFLGKLAGSDVAHVAGLLQNDLKGELNKLGPAAGSAVHSLVAGIVKNPTLAGLTSDALAASQHVAEPIARAAKACVSVPKNGPKGLSVVKTGILQQLAGAPPKPPVAAPSVGAVKYVDRVGSEQVFEDVRSLVRLDTHRTMARATDLAAAERLVQLQATVRHYLSLPS